MSHFKTISTSYSGIALPQRAGPGLQSPVPPREAGTTLMPIVAFPCVRTKHQRKFCGLLQVQHWAAGQWDDLAIERSLSVTYYGEEGVGLSVIALKGIEGEPLIISFR